MDVLDYIRREVSFLILCVCSWGMLSGFYACSDDVQEETPLQVSKTNLFFGPATASQDVTVSSPGDWTAKVMQGSDWCSCVQQSATLRIIVEDNNTGEKRTAKIQISCGAQQVNLEVEQESVDPKLEISGNALQFQVAGGVQEVKVTANVDWTAQVVTAMTDWVTCNVKEGTDDVLLITVKSNPTTRKRVAMIRVTASALTEEITISQDFATSSIIYPQIETSFNIALLEDTYGTTLPDFSHVGYMGSEIEIPNVPVVRTLTSPGENEDATAIIQRAIDEVSSMPLSGDFRGAILLKSGTYRI